MEKEEKHLRMEKEEKRIMEIKELRNAEENGEIIFLKNQGCEHGEKEKKEKKEYHKKEPKKHGGREDQKKGQLKKVNQKIKKRTSVII
jgi:hypothetical protein